MSSKSGASEISLKQSLRKTEFPKCAQEALNRIVDLICGRITSIKNMDLALDLMAEFIFLEVDRRGNKKEQSMTPLLELQLINILYEFLTEMPHESARNTVFLSIFSGTTAVMRLGVLTKLVSVAIAIPSPSILSSASAWMQQLGNCSQNSCKLAEGLIQEYFHFYNNNTVSINHIPATCPQFTANFLTAISENYFTFPKKEPLFPPEVLMGTITSWVTENPGLCIAAQKKQAVLPPGAIAMEATTPIAGLLRWTILAPIYKQNNETYSNLHLALLNSILEIPKVTPPKAVYAQHLTGPINPILSYVNELKSKHELKLDQILEENNLQLALDRYAQAIQVVNSVNAMYGHMDDLFHQLKLLPFNKLMSIVISTYNKYKVIVL